MCQKQILRGWVFILSVASLRNVTVNRIRCIPAGLTRIITLTLGIRQWCLASVSWEADVKIARAEK